MVFTIAVTLQDYPTQLHMYGILVAILLLLVFLWCSECPCGCKRRWNLCNGLTGCHHAGCVCGGRANRLFSIELSPMELPPQKPDVTDIYIDAAPIVAVDHRYGPRLISNASIKVSAKEGFDPVYKRQVNKTRHVYLHYTNWCGFCKKMKPVWERVKEALSTSGIEFHEVDEDIAKTPGINGYPTIEMLDENGYRRLYSGQIDFAQLRNWVAAARV